MQRKSNSAHISLRTPPYPKSKFLTPEKYPVRLLDYQTKDIGGVTYVKGNHYRPYYVEYTHPDNYGTYDIGAYDWWRSPWMWDTQGYVIHIPKTIAALPAPALCAAIGAAIGGGIGAIIGVVLGIITNGIVLDENGESWTWTYNWDNEWWGYQFDWKIGGITWMHGALIFLFPIAYPLNYGWDPELGVGGW